MLEFSLAGKILVEDKRLIIIDNTLTGNEILDKALDIIDSSPKQKSVKYWVSKLEHKMKGLKRDILSQLIKKDILIEMENRFLWVIPTKRYPTNNPEPENQVRKRVKAIVLDEKASDERSKLLISLINSCSLVNEIFCKDERKVAKNRIKEIVESEKVGESITDTINEIIMAVIKKFKAVKISQNHLLGIQDLSISEVSYILDEAKAFIKLNKSSSKKTDVLRGKTQINLFFEPSTRTQSSFELAGKRLGADVMSMNIVNSAIKKGETLIDTAMTLNAMHPDIIVVRHQDSGAPNLLSQKVNCSVINAGDGRREHPTQALLDALTIINRRGKVEGLKIAICGDILHSRVARSNIYLMSMLGAEINVVAPKTLLPHSIERLGVNVFTDMKKGLDNCDIVMMLRLQNERMQGSFLPSAREYYEYFGLTPDKMAKAKKEALIMHPGPMNRGVEIDTNLADDINKSVIREQVELGVAVRMACLKIYCKKI